MFSNILYACAVFVVIAKYSGKPHNYAGYAQLANFMRTSSQDASCGVSTTLVSAAPQQRTVYNFSCTDMCSYWVLYVLDSSVPLGGRCSTLPCVLDTTSVMKDATTVYNSLNLVSKNWITISTNGSLTMVAQCAYLASYKDPLVVRQGVMLRTTP